MAVGSALWNKVFGEGWQIILELQPDIGMFLIDHESKTADADENAFKLLDLHEPPDYQSMLNIAAQLLSTGQ